jgi:UDP-N-acetylglucosamine--N-acetylmuramyl-(pentapeptide) pyrophosphoryl-undecaprenol N-acetylglucosamine transferase
MKDPSAPPILDPNHEASSPGPRPPAPGPFLMAGGGTGGHVIPALAVARELRARGHSVYFIGTARGLEARLVPQEGFELHMIDIGGLNRVGAAQRLATLMRLPFVTGACLREVGSVSAVFSMGGYVAGPPVMAALLRRKPVVVMEPNAIPGFTNRVIARFVSRALISFVETRQFFPPGRTEMTGLPVRKEFFEIQPKPSGSVLNVLITGGSQGSRTLNRAARESWPIFRSASFPIRMVHQTGAADFEAAEAEFAKCGLVGEVVPFIHDMPAAFADADLVICRSGAGAVSELAAAGKPSILVPFPFAADDHQTRNAEAMERGGAARLVRDAEWSGAKMYATVRDVAGNLAAMGANARRLATPGAAARAADILEEVARARL